MNTKHAAVTCPCAVVMLHNRLFLHPAVSLLPPHGTPGLGCPLLQPLLQGAVFSSPPRYGRTQALRDHGPLGELTRSAPTPYRRQMLLPLSFVAPCLPTKAPHPPTGTIWVHEIKHDGFRIIARKDGNRVRLYSRAGNDLTDRFPLIVAALGAALAFCDS